MLRESCVSASVARKAAPACRVVTNFARSINNSAREDERAALLERIGRITRAKASAEAEVLRAGILFDRAVRVALPRALRYAGMPEHADRFAGFEPFHPQTNQLLFFSALGDIMDNLSQETLLADRMLDNLRRILADLRTACRTFTNGDSAHAFCDGAWPVLNMWLSRAELLQLLDALLSAHPTASAASAHWGS